MGVNHDHVDDWLELLTPEQKDQLQWLVTHRCTVEVRRAAPDPLHDLPAGVVIEILVNKHAVVKVRATDVPSMFDYAFKSAQSLFEFVETYDPTWRAPHDGADEPEQDEQA